MRVKATLNQHFSKEGPVNGIISFVEIDLEEHRTDVFVLHMMDNLMEGKDPIQDISPFREGRLVRVMNSGGNKDRPSSVPFHEDPKYHIEDCDRAELSNVRRTWHLGN